MKHQGCESSAPKYLQKLMNTMTRTVNSAL